MTLARTDGAPPRDRTHHIGKILDMFRVYTAPGANPRCVSVSLTHSVMTPNGGWAQESLIEHAWVHLKDQGLLEDEIAEKANEIYQAASEHANTFPDMPQRYAVVCLGPKDKWLRRHDMMLQADPSVRQLMMGPSEPATETGLLAVGLRYNEALTKSTFEKDTHLFAMAMRENEALREENARLRQEVSDMRDQAFRHMKMTQEMMTMRAKLEIEAERRRLDPMRANAEREGELWGVFREGILPKLVEGATGSPLLGAGASGLLKFIQNLPQEKVTAMLSHLTESEMEGFMSAVGGKANGAA